MTKKDLSSRKNALAAAVYLYAALQLNAGVLNTMWLPKLWK
jgi:hypothetical protein